MTVDKLYTLKKFLDDSKPISFEYNGETVFVSDTFIKDGQVMCNISSSIVGGAILLVASAKQVFHRMGWDYSPYT